MADNHELIRNLHTAMRRYAIERMNSFEQLKRTRGGVYTPSPELLEPDRFMEIMPRFLFLNCVRWELDAIDPQTLKTLEEARELFDIAAQIARDHSFGAKPEPTVQNVVREEYAAFSDYLGSLSPDALHSIEPLPYFRALGKKEHSELLAKFGQRWGVTVEKGSFERDYYPVVPRVPDLPAIEAFDAEALVEADGSRIVQRILLDHGIQRVFSFEENYPGVEFEAAQLNLARAIPRIVGFAFSESLDWMIHTSWQGT